MFWTTTDTISHSAEDSGRLVCHSLYSIHRFTRQILLFPSADCIALFISPNTSFGTFVFIAKIPLHCGYFYLLHLVLICTTLSIMAIFCLFRSFFAKSSSRLWGSCVARIVVNVIKKEAGSCNRRRVKQVGSSSGRQICQRTTDDRDKENHVFAKRCLSQFVRPVKQTWDVL